MTSVIKTENITKMYGDTAAVNNVSLTLNQGEIYGLVGRNGAGKTTLFKILMGITHATTGSISIFNDTSQSGLSIGRHSIGFSLGSNFFPYLNARQNLEYMKRVKGIRDDATIDEVLKLVGLDKVKKPFKAFSTGMKQRLGLANALMGSPKIILLDEPLNGLDPQGISDFRNLVLKLNREKNLTFILSSHILGELDLLATQYGFLEKGILLEEISQEALHEKTRTAIRVNVSNTAKASTVIEEAMHCQNYRIISASTIIIEDELEPDILAYHLVSAGIGLKELTLEKLTLEDYFIQLIGERNHD